MGECVWCVWCVCCVQCACDLVESADYPELPPPYNTPYSPAEMTSRVIHLQSAVGSLTRVPKPEPLGHPGFLAGSNALLSSPLLSGQTSLAFSRCRCRRLLQLSARAGAGLVHQSHRLVVQVPHLPGPTFTVRAGTRDDGRQQRIGQRELVLYRAPFPELLDGHRPAAAARSRLFDS